MRWAVLLVCGALTGCRFDLPATPPDGPPGDLPDQQMGDSRLCFGSGLGMLCLPSAPAVPRDLSGTLDTGIDTICDHLVDVTGVQTCVIAGTAIDITSGARLRATGSRPLILVATGPLTVAGELDAGSERAGASGPGAPNETCAGHGAASDDGGGGGGGAGGSFAGSGGVGGTGDSNDNGPPIGPAAGGTPAPSAIPTRLQAGCRGGNGGSGGAGSLAGIGGRGGGAVYLIAGTALQVTGRVTAYGAGGGGGDEQAGAGGGGSGGMIGLDAPVVAVGTSGVVAANGGGGGEGGAVMTVPGGNGSNGTNTAQRAAGGEGVDVQGGNGGAGSGGGSATGGEVGAPGAGGGGGGGGGAGFVYIKGTARLNGLISPEPTEAAAP